jgi:outer membrane receptor for ferrienterochelin and colicin/copper chaperone CopZ
MLSYHLKLVNMKQIKYALVGIGILACVTTYGQNQQTALEDSMVSFKVSGTCIQCKDRIESVVKGKGVRSANWDMENKTLSLTYNPSQTNLAKIRKKIVAAGHDVEEMKAPEKTYKALPACCHYREIKPVAHEAAPDTLQEQSITATTPVVTSSSNLPNHLLKGVVLESNKKGIFKPLPGASVIWLGTKNGTTTDSTGIFNIREDATSRSLVVSYSGYEPDTLTVPDFKELKIILAANNQLGDVIVTAKQRSTYLSATNPIRTQVMTGKELFKAACCNLSESFETNPSVDVSYNDAVTGSKQIQLLGLSGNYTQLTVENLPGPRGLATPLGLNSIAGPWVESIQLTKGIGSVANGYESIAGQINVELKKPENSEKLYANVYVNDFGKTDLNLNLSGKIGTKWSTALLLHDDFLTARQLDFNKDGFRDLPTGNQFSLINRWKYDDGKGLLTQFGVKFLNDRRTGGEVGYDPVFDKNTTRKYGLGINTDRFEAFAKTGYVFPEKKYKSIGLQLAFVDHRQDSYFGLTTYDAKQQSVYGNLIYQSIIGNTAHKFRTGASFQQDQYDENFKSLNFKRTETVPGVFFEYTYTANEKFTLVGGVRADHNNLFGFVASPRLHLRYEPIKGTTIRASAGRGQRTANIFAENTSVFVSSRQVNIIDAVPGKAYGLDPEVAWNKGISLDQKFKLFHRDGLISIDYFRNDFTSQVIVDMENPREINFYNLQGKSFSNSLQAELNFELVKKLDLRLAYRHFDVKSTYGNKLLQRPLTSADRAFANLAYSTNGWKFDYTINYNGKKRIPGTLSNPVEFQRDPSSPAFILMNGQVSKTVGKKRPIDFYLGAENLTNYFQKNVIVAAGQPFSPYFDASLVWGPVTGRMFYAGARFKIK